MNTTTATCGHSVLAIGQAGSPARNVVEQQPCAKCQTIPIDSLVAESHEIAARVVAMRPDSYTPESVSASINHMANTLAATAKASEERAKQAEKDERAVRRHLKALIERVGNIHEGLQAALRGSGPFGEYVADLGDLLDAERKDLAECRELIARLATCPLCGKPEAGPPGEEMRTGSKGEFWRTCSNVKHQR